MDYASLLLVFCLSCHLAISALGLSCFPCEQVTCGNKPKCSFGVVKDTCGCCYVCAKGPGERCMGPFGIYGKCGRGMVCKTSNSENEALPLGMAEGACMVQKDRKLNTQDENMEIQNTEGKRKILRTPTWNQQGSPSYIRLPKRKLSLYRDTLRSDPNYGKVHHDPVPSPKRSSSSYMLDSSNMRLRPARRLYISE